jgi:hypothetical protein
VRSIFQQTTAFGTLLFVGYHVLEWRAPRAFGKLDYTACVQELHARLSSAYSGMPLYAGAYLLGMAVTSFHVSYAGYLGYRRARPLVPEKRVSGAAALLGLFLFAVGAETVIYYATGSRFLFF